MSATACANPAPMNQPGHFADAVTALSRGGHIDRAHVEQALGVKLASADDGNGPFAAYAGEARLGDVKLTIDLREPVKGGSATAGPLLNLRVVEGCPTRPEIEQRFGPLEISGAPRGRSLDETTGFGRSEPWGRLTFGFAERRPDCLAVVTFAVDR